MPDSSQFLTVIDATDATVLPPETSPAALTPEQEKTLGTCEFQLRRLGRRIAARESDLIYLYVERGWHLSKAQAVYSTESLPERLSANSGFFSGRSEGFSNFLARPEINIPKANAYKYIQAAKNAGLTPESTSDDVKALRDAAKLAGKTLTALCRAPVNKENRQAEEHELTTEEQIEVANAERLQRWTTLGDHLQVFGLEREDWLHLDLEPRKLLYEQLTELCRRIRPTLKKLVGDKSLAIEVSVD